MRRNRPGGRQAGHQHCSPSAPPAAPNRRAVRASRRANRRPASPAHCPQALLDWPPVYYAAPLQFSLRAPMTSHRPDIRSQFGLRRIINVSGTMTSLGASIVVPEAVETIHGVLTEFVEINELHRRASEAIARATGAEAGCMTASCSSGISIAVAGCMTGADLARIEQLPDTTGMKDEVLIQVGHMVHYGAPIEQAIRLTGAQCVPVGQATYARPYHLVGKMTERTAAAVYVVSHHAVQYEQIGLVEFCDICRTRGVPVIVDAASEYDLRGFLAKGADLVGYSAQKFLGGQTPGIV